MMKEKQNVQKLINKAFVTLMENDKYLLQNDVNERSLTHRLAIYLERYFAVYFSEYHNYSVDCEYNRKGSIPKELFCLIDTVKTDDTKGKTVYPDIIIHQRGDSPCVNLIVIEAKKNDNLDSNLEAHDLKKLQEYQKELKYRYAYFVVFPSKDDVEDYDLSSSIKQI